MPLDRRDWLKTPYAKTDAKDPDAAIFRLLEKYQIVKFSTIHDTIGGRPGFGVRFHFKGLWYVVAFPILEVKQVEPHHLLRQIKRLVYYTLKTLLEGSSVFMPPEQLLLPFLEVEGTTLYDRIANRLTQIQAGTVPGLLLTTDEKR